VIGDAACFVDKLGNALPGVSPTAMQMGRYVARIIRNELSGTRDAKVRGRAPFRYVDKGSMATIGRSRAIAQVKDMRLSGVMAWLAWLVVHIWYLIGFRNRFFVMFDWAWSYFTYRRGARLITGGRLEPGAPLSIATTPSASTPRREVRVAR
jgi:NADH dehydrogenase